MRPLFALAVSLAGLVGCGDDGAAIIIDAAPIDASGCDPATLLPTAYRPVAMTSTGAVTVTTTGGTTSGTIDATAGGLAGAADRPYIYVDLLGGTKAAINDLDARTAGTWDVALKRSSLRINGGDSGSGGRQVAVVQAATLGAVTAGPASGYADDDFSSDDCMLATNPGGEPVSAFGEWYAYDTGTHVVTPKPEIYVVERMDGTRTAFRVDAYYGDSSMPMRGAFYRVEWKQLPPR